MRPCIPLQDALALGAFIRTPSSTSQRLMRLFTQPTYPAASLLRVHHILHCKRPFWVYQHEFLRIQVYNTDTTTLLDIIAERHGRECQQATLDTFSILSRAGPHYDGLVVRVINWNGGDGPPLDEVGLAHDGDAAAKGSRFAGFRVFGKSKRRQYTTRLSTSSSTSDGYSQLLLARLSAIFCFCCR